MLSAVYPGTLLGSNGMLVSGSLVWTDVPPISTKLSRSLALPIRAPRPVSIAPFNPLYCDAVVTSSAVVTLSSEVVGSPRTPSSPLVGFTSVVVVTSSVVTTPISDFSTLVLRLFYLVLMFLFFVVFRPALVVLRYALFR